MMKKLLIFSTIFVFTSCAVLKKDKTTTTKQTEKTEVLSDSISKEVVNKGIEDKATFKVAESDTGDKDFDNRVNDAVANILRSINFQKSSGDNSYRLYYDEKLRTLEAQIQVGETSNKETSSENVVNTEKTFEQSVEEYTKKITGSWITWLLLIFIFRKTIFGILTFVFPQIKGLKTLKDVITPPNK